MIGEDIPMKKLIVLILASTVMSATILPAMGQTRHRSRFGRKARTAAIIEGGAGVGVRVKGKKGAAIGAGGAGLYALTVSQRDIISEDEPGPPAQF